MLPIFIAGFTLGFAGSLHCVGMCGPLSLALPTHHLSAAQKLSALLSYQLGRVLTYATIGLLFSTIGRTLYIAGWQQWFSIISGVLILWLAVMSFSKHLPRRQLFLQKIYAMIAKQVALLLQHPPKIFGFLFIGMANGLLPCGMVYMALAASLSFHKIEQGVAFMAMFGLGTLPAMMMFSFSAQSVSPQWRNGFKKAVPYFVMLTGIMLILRGLQLGIPYISPQLPAASGEVVSCHP